MKFNLIELLIVVGMVVMVLLGTLMAESGVRRKVHEVQSAQPLADLNNAWDNAFERQGRRPRGAYRP